jgi:hypothetical protein
MGELEPAVVVPGALLKVVLSIHKSICWFFSEL